MTDDDTELKYKRYSENLKHAFADLRLFETEEKRKVKEIVDLAEGYFNDAEHFKNIDMRVTALISLAYSEGLLDALRLLNLVSFEWEEKKNVR